MAFTPETGSGVAGANAYIAVAFFREHHTDRGREVSSIVDTDVETAIVRATDYVDKRFSRVYRGFRQSREQGLEWPRISAFDDDDYLLSEVPNQLEKATAEYAIRAHILKELAPDAPRAAPSQDLSDATNVITGTEQASGVVTRSADQVGPIRTERSYTSQAEIQAILRDRNAYASGLVSGVYIPSYPEADLWIQEIITPSTLRRVLRG